MAIQLLSAPANTPRVDYDPATGELRGLLIEEQRTNYFANSVNFGDFTGSGVTLSESAVVAPDGNHRWYTMTEDSSTGNHRAYSSVIGLTTGQKYTLNVVAEREAGGHYLTLGFINSAAFTAPPYAVFDIDNVTCEAATNSETISADITDLGSGRVLCQLTFQLDTAGNVTAVYSFNNTYTAGYASFTGDGTSAINLVDPQLENGPHASSRIQTSGAQATRAADSVSIAVPWLNASEFCFVANVMRMAPINDSTQLPRILNLMYDSGANGGGLTLFGLFFTQTDLRARLYGNGTFNGNIVFPLVVAKNTAYKCAVSVSSAGISISVNGSAVESTALTDSLPVSPATLNIGNYGGNQYFLNGWIRDLKYFPHAPTDSELQALSS